MSQRISSQCQRLCLLHGPHYSEWLLASEADKFISMKKVGKKHLAREVPFERESLCFIICKILGVDKISPMPIVKLSSLCIVHKLLLVPEV